MRYIMTEEEKLKKLSKTKELKDLTAKAAEVKLKHVLGRSSPTFSTQRLV